MEALCRNQLGQRNISLHTLSVYVCACFVSLLIMSVGSVATALTIDLAKAGCGWCSGTLVVSRWGVGANEHIARIDSLTSFQTTAHAYSGEEDLSDPLSVSVNYAQSILGPLYYGGVGGQGFLFQDSNSASQVIPGENVRVSVNAELFIESENDYVYIAETRTAIRSPAAQHYSVQYLDGGFLHNRHVYTDDSGIDPNPHDLYATYRRGFSIYFTSAMLVPEPSMWLLVGLGIVGLLVQRSVKYS